MKKSKSSISTSPSSLRSSRSSKQFRTIVVDDENVSLDQLLIQIHSLRLSGLDSKPCMLKVTFMDQIIINSVIRPSSNREPETFDCIAAGRMNYDPSDYEKMCLYADHPLIVHMYPLESGIPSPTLSQVMPTGERARDIHCCYVDILPLFIDEDKLCVRKRLQPLYRPPLLMRQSWDNLPLLTMEVSVKRESENHPHHERLQKANYLKITLLGAFNMIMPYNKKYLYTAATIMPVDIPEKYRFESFSFGSKVPRHFRHNDFNVQWDSERDRDGTFAEGDEKLKFSIDEMSSMYSPDGIDLKHYFEDKEHSVIWSSFHRTLMLGDSEKWFQDRIQNNLWPFELHMCGEDDGLSFMTGLDLFSFLYPGEDTVRVALPLQWMDATMMKLKTACDPFLAPFTKPPSAITFFNSRFSDYSGSGSPSTDDLSLRFRPTGADGTSAFVILEIKLQRPFKKPHIVAAIPTTDIDEMLSELEVGEANRFCTGRGQLDHREWPNIVNMASNSLRRIPYYGATDFCSFIRQLSETRTKVEILASFCQEAAVAINNKFVVQDFLDTEEKYEELLMFGHAVLMKSAVNVLVGTEQNCIYPVLRAARHARQLQDYTHAVDLYTQVAVEQKKYPDNWRELSTALLDVDRDWAMVCLQQALMLNPRHPLSLLSMGCLVFDENPEAAEPFFESLLNLYPRFTTVWVIATAYYIDRRMFLVAEHVERMYRLSLAEGVAYNEPFPRNWEYELGDWWDSTPLLPGMNRYYDAADLLLRLRAFSLADVCISRALLESGESAAYSHLVALSCRLRGNFDDAICHIRSAIENYGEITYLRTLEAECLHNKDDYDAAAASFLKAGGCVGAYSILLSLPCREESRVRPILVDLLRRQPSAHAWVALADNWLQRRQCSSEPCPDSVSSRVACAAACARQALRLDRRAGRAWALLAATVAPNQRRAYCAHMARMCGYADTEERIKSESDRSLCYTLGKALKHCRCRMCDHISVT